jgi:hypothetical protein
MSVSDESENGNADTITAVQDQNIIVPKTTVIRGRNGHVWSTRITTRSGRTSTKNIVYFTQGSRDIAKNATSPKECFELFISANIVDTTLLHTN